MKSHIIRPNSPWRWFLPLVQKIRHSHRRFTERICHRLIISGGRIRFLDVELNFPEEVAVLYSTSLFWEGPEAYELATSRAIALLAGRSRVFFDIGSNMGLYAVYTGMTCKQSMIYAFEPVPDIWKKNCSFHAANQLPTGNVFQLALSDRNGPQNIFIPVFTGAVEVEQTATLRADSWQANHEKVEKIEIQCVTLDTFTSSHPVPAGFCALKIDVENFEAAVLRGGKQFIQERRPWMVCEILPREGYDAATKTLHNDNAETVKMLGELNYAAFAILNDGYFRFSAADFTRPREFKDFLLIPMEKVAADVQYLSSSSLRELLPAG